MLQQNMRVLQAKSIKDWSRPATTFQDLAIGHGIGRYLQAAGPSTLRCRAPILLDRQGERSFFFPNARIKDVYEVPLAPVRLDAVPRAQVVGEKFVVVSNDSKVFSESYWSEQNLNDGVHFVRQTSKIIAAPSIRMLPTTLFRDGTPTRHVKRTAILLGNPWSFNFHHWIVNCLSRLWWKDLYPELNDVPIIVPERLKPFQQQSLAAMQIASDQMLSFDGANWLIDHLYFPSNGDFWPTQLRWIRQRLFDHFGIVDSPGDRLLYISRSDAPGRRVTNEPEVIKYLSGRGFEVLELSLLSLGEQVRAFSQARIVVGPHGSGLTNLMFGPDNLCTVELHPDDEINHVFWVMANAMQQRYAFLSGKKINSDRDFVVERADLEAILEIASR